MYIQCKRSCGFCSKYDIIGKIPYGVDILVFCHNTIIELTLILLFLFSLVAHDLYQEIPKTTCLPELNQKYEMITTAKFACANDPHCSGLVEAPKRRGQQRKFGEYSLTEREYILCSYPPHTKTTTDTLYFRKRGKLGINQHLNNLDNFDVWLIIKILIINVTF